MKAARFAYRFVPPLAIAILVLASAAFSGRTKFDEPQAGKSSDPAIRWQFDAHG